MRPRALERELPAVSGAPTRPRGALPASARRVLTQSLNDELELSCPLQKKAWDRHAHTVYPYGKRFVFV